MRTIVVTLTRTLALTLALCGANAALAETPEEIVRALLPKASQPLTRSFKPPAPAPAPGGLSRSFRPAEPGAQGLTRGVAVEGGDSEPEPEGPPKIDLYVNFEFNNSALTLSDARIALDALGKALTDPRLAGMRFAIIGHTDAVGTDAYNMDLSRRRADSVRQYLVQFHRVDAGRLEAEGRGMRELKIATDPTSSINRRVEVRNLIGSSPPRPMPAPPPQISAPPVPAPRVASNDPALPLPASPPRPVVRWSERVDFGLGDRRREHIDRLPDRPAAWTAAPAPSAPLEIAQRAQAFTSRGEAAARAFIGLFEQRFGRKGAPTDAADVVGRAGVALAADAGVAQLSVLQLLNRHNIRDAVAEALVIAQAWRNLEQSSELAAADEGQRADILQRAFASAGQTVMLQTRAVAEAARLKRSAESLVTAVSDLRVRGVSNGDLDALAVDHGRALLQMLEEQMPALRQEAGEAGTVANLEMRRKLLDCVAIRLDTVIDVAGRAAPPASAPVRDVAMSMPPLLVSIAADSLVNCQPLLLPSDPQRGAPPVPVDAAPPTNLRPRKADNGHVPPARLAGQPLE